MESLALLAVLAVLIVIRVLFVIPLFRCLRREQERAAERAPRVDAILARVRRMLTRAHQARHQAQLFRIMLEGEQAALLDARASGRYSSHALERAQMIIDTDIARTSGGSVT